MDYSIISVRSSSCHACSVFWYSFPVFIMFIAKWSLKCQTTVVDLSPSLFYFFSMLPVSFNCNFLELVPLLLDVIIVSISLVLVTFFVPKSTYTPSLALLLLVFAWWINFNFFFVFTFFSLSMWYIDLFYFYFLCIWVCIWV